MASTDRQSQSRVPPAGKMDLKRKLGINTGNGQSYELIRSTQSLVDRLNLNSEDISIQPVHPSIMGQVTPLVTGQANLRSESITYLFTYGQ